VSPQSDGTDKLGNSLRSTSIEETLDGVLKTLAPQEEMVIRATYGYGQPYDDGKLVDHQHWLQRTVAKNLGLSQPSVSRLHARALRKLYHPSRKVQFSRQFVL
jgi:DNA-directed RNA polymerase sigma subunit (sigma70/sigma32)